MSEEIQSSAKDEALEDSNVGSPDSARVDERGGRDDYGGRTRDSIAYR